MDLVEYQGKQYFARYGVPVSPGEVADTVAEAEAAAERLGYPVVVKAQVQVGGRGKAGGVKLAGSPAEVAEHAGNILGLDIKGHVVRRLWIEKATDIAKEYYASFTLDRSAKLHLAMVSARGGVDIEQVAEEDPEAVARLHVNPLDGLSGEAALDLVERAGLDPVARAGRSRGPGQALPVLHRRRRRPRRDQPARAHHRRRGTGARRQGDPRRRRRLPPPRVVRVREHGRADRARAPRQGEGALLHRPRRHGGHHRQRGRARHEHRRRREPGRGQRGQLLGRRGRCRRRGDGERPRGDQPRPERRGRSSSTSSAGSSAATTSPAASCAALGSVDIASQIVLRLDGTNAAEAHKIIAERGLGQDHLRGHHARAPRAGRSSSPPGASRNGGSKL